MRASCLAHPPRVAGPAHVFPASRHLSQLPGSTDHCQPTGPCPGNLGTFSPPNVPGLHDKIAWNDCRLPNPVLRPAPVHRHARPRSALPMSPVARIVFPENHSRRLYRPCEPRLFRKNRIWNTPFQIRFFRTGALCQEAGRVSLNQENPPILPCSPGRRPEPDKPWPPCRRGVNPTVVRCLRRGSINPSLGLVQRKTDTFSTCVVPPLPRYSGERGGGAGASSGVRPLTPTLSPGVPGERESNSSFNSRRPPQLTETKWYIRHNMNCLPRLKESGWSRVSPETVCW